MSGSRKMKDHKLDIGLWDNDISELHKMQYTARL